MVVAQCIVRKLTSRCENSLPETEITSKMMTLRSTFGLAVGWSRVQFPAGMAAEFICPRSMFCVNSVLRCPFHPHKTPHPGHSAKRAGGVVQLNTYTHMTNFSSVSLYVHRKHKDYLGRRAQDGHLDFLTVPELCLDEVGVDCLVSLPCGKP